MEDNANKEDGRQRSTISFPYNDLASAIALSQAIHNHVGLGDCDDSQLAAWTDQSPKSSGFRVQLSAARMFKLIDSASSGRHKLSGLGRMIIDPNRAREAKVRAFLNVPLYREVFEKYRSDLLPPSSALERDMEALGVAPKMKDRARRTFERSAEQAGFFEQGKARLVMPGVTKHSPEHAVVKDPVHEPSSGERKSRPEDGVGKLHPFIQGLLKTLPDPDSEAEWSVAQRVKWLQTAAHIFDLIYEGDGGVIEVRTAGASNPTTRSDEQQQ